MTTRAVRQRGVQRALKVLLDRVAALVALVIISPVLAAIALAIRARMGSPVSSSRNAPAFAGARFTW